ncbi:pseudouridine synthase [uncultured Faecalibaculum sp.]|uniref:pseudouridine synthase n=5 Tax=uncultured Faecalibaculum sp. TaxID=1729681 RepID=UPI0025D9E483|nr:pseudouridine synthase [uncultured Faecalibaculum sp.]
MERLQKVIAQAGVCSRRKAEALIARGRVRVNGKVVTEPGTKVSGSDAIEVNGKVLDKEDKVYYLMNKPKGTICSVSDDKERKTVLDYLPKDKRIYPVGRLDFDTSGILLLTNDGEFTNRMIHPRYHVPKTYTINLQGMLTPEDIQRLKTGLKTRDESYQPAKVRILQKDYTRDRMILELTISEGKNHQVKNMMEALGHEVRKLNRKSFGPLSAEGMKPGEYRVLKRHEIRELLRLAAEGEQRREGEER